LSVSRPSVALAMPKSMTLGTATPSFTVTRMFDGFYVAVNDGLLMRVLDRLADLDEQVEPFPRGRFVLVAVIG